MTPTVTGAVRHVPNALTVSRVLLVPVVAALLLIAPENHAARWAATGVFAAAMITDLADGMLARRWQVVSNFGKLADPIADKAMVAVLLGVLAALGEVPWLMAVVVIGREVLVTVGRLLVASRTVVAAAWSGKVKTVIQSVGLMLVLVPWSLEFSWWQGMALAILWVAAALTVYSGWQIACSLLGKSA